MKSKTKSTALLLTGMMIGASLTPAVHAAENWLKATPSCQVFIVDGKSVDLEAYTINGSNYVRLRDIGKAVGFNVSYDPQFNAAVIDTNKSYRDDAPVEQPNQKSTTAATVTQQFPDYSKDAGPSIFRGDLTRNIYNSLRDAILHQDEIVARSYPNPQLSMESWSSEVSHVTSSFSCYPVFEPILQDGTFICDVCLPDAYIPATEHTQEFIDSLAGFSDREKIEKLVWYVADRITYQVAYPGPEKVLTQDGQIPGCCAAYAYNLLFLCNRAGIPCVLRVGGNHEWNTVYVDGQWWDVDVTANDCGDETEHREYSTILHDLAESEMTGYRDEYPHITAFSQELLVPGSTK